MTPEAAVVRLVEIIDSDAEFTEDSVYAAMAESGIPNAIADRAFKFTQLAFGRLFLDGMGIKFPADYLCFDAAGDVIESGVLSEQPYFAAAMTIARRGPPRGLPRLALMSSDVNAVNSALNAGSKPENLVAGPPVMFMESPTPVGIDKARQVLRDRLPAPAKKPWWRFW
jgi:hypothetical protein